MLLPAIGENGGNTPSIAVMTIREFTEIAAPELSKDESIYAISLTEAIKEFFGQDIADFVRGDSVLSLRSIEVLLSALQSGVFGQTDLTSNETIQGLVSSLGDTAGSLLRNRAGNTEVGAFDVQVREALDGLDDEERSRLDNIVQQLVERSLQRASDRLATVDRVV